MKNLLGIIIAAALTLTACSKTKEAEDNFQSTTVNEDGTVTFNYYNPDAKAVQVDVQFAGRNDMILDTLTGIWSVTLGPAAPDMYPYCFIVDGVSIMDPANQQYFPNEGFKNSLLDIPGKDAPLVHSIKDVPHGKVDYVKYYSDAIGTYNNALVYTPPTYDENPDKSYPVFYLISGTTDTEEVYYKVGRVNYILDNLLADGKAEEMIVVMPYGNPTKLMNEPPKFGPGMKDYFSTDLIEDLMPYVESNYRTINDADHRAIGGFSRGGNQGLMNGLMNLDKFSYLCSYSSFTSPALPNVYDDPTTNDKIHLLWSGVGTDDFLYGNARDYTEFLDGKGITCVKYYTDDKFGHTWMNAKCFLAETLPLLFNEEASAAAMAAATPTKARTGEEKEFTPGVMARLFPTPIISPEINGTDVTFRIKAEGAKTVVLVGDMGEKAYVMDCDSTGLWSVTVSDIAPDVYCYNFEVDGTQVADNQNMYLAPDFGFKRSILDTSASPDAQIKYTPVRYHMEGTDNAYATVEPTHDSESDLPVIALIAGPNDTFESWIKIAKANIVLDQMMAAGNCQPHKLVISESPVEGAAITLNSADYKSWSEARKALMEALK